jgi:hypothetical protein
MAAWTIADAVMAQHSRQFAIQMSKLKKYDNKLL